MTPVEAIMGLRDLFGRARVSVWQGDDGALHMRGAPEATVTEFGGHRVVVEDRAPAADPLKAQIEAGTSRIQSATVVARALAEGAAAKAALQKEKPMGSLQDVARRIADARKSLTTEADKISERVDDLLKKAPEVLDRAHTIVGQSVADLAAMEDELRQLSNLPFDDSSTNSR